MLAVILISIGAILFLGLVAYAVHRDKRRHEMADHAVTMDAIRYRKWVEGGYDEPYL